MARSRVGIAAIVVVCSLAPTAKADPVMISYCASTAPGFGAGGDPRLPTFAAACVHHFELDAAARVRLEPVLDSGFTGQIEVRIHSESTIVLRGSDIWVAGLASQTGVYRAIFDGWPPPLEATLPAGKYKLEVIAGTSGVEDPIFGTRTAPTALPAVGPFGGRVLRL